MILARLKTWYRESFARNPAKSLAVFTLVSSFLWVVQTSLCQRILPRDVIEAIVWGEEMQWGQMKSPPLSGWLAAFFSYLTGHADWGLYLLDQLTIICAVFFVYKLAREFFDEYGAAVSAMLLFFLFYYMPPSMKFCSHATQVALLPAIGWFFWRGIRDNRLRDWCLLALFAALATLGKYSAIQVLLGCFVFMIFRPEARKRFASPGPYLAAGLYLLLLLPHILWLFDHDFLSVKHLGDRLEDVDKGFFIALQAILATAMPYLVFGIVLTLVRLPEKPSWRRFREELPRSWSDPRRQALIYSLILTLVPELFYLVPACAGESIVVAWFSYLAGFTGITAAALLPPEVTKRIFRRLCLVLWCWFIILFIGNAADVTSRSRLRIHSDPQAIVGLAEKFYKERSFGREIPLVYGDRWFAGVIQNYSPHRPKTCVSGDICNMELYRDRLKREGALIIFKGRKDYAAEFRAAGLEPVELFPVEHTFKAPFGRKKRTALFLGYLPPAEEGKKSENKQTK
ncbi:MAG: glycosyltransferase family 39 protein [Lentisphaeria bacterium]|nr:glycosyltransferase family 39 protein [Lentisphaeria bacterium]